MSGVANNFKYQSEVLKYTEEELVRILAKFDRNFNNIGEDIGVIRQWLKVQKHILIETGDKEILYFLICCKFSLEKTKERLNMYYCIRDILPEIYKNRKVSSKEIQRILKIVDVIVLPDLSKDLNRVIIYRVVDSKSLDFDADSVNACIALLLDGQPLLDFCSSNEFVADLSNFPFEFLLKYSIVDLKKILLAVEKVYSIRLAKMHLINMPKYFGSFLALAKLLLKKKIRERILLHDSFETLYEHIPKASLPSDFGGDSVSIAELKKNFEQTFMDYDDHYEKLNGNAVDASLVPDKVQNDEILGFHGSFKKLQVD